MTKHGDRLTRWLTLGTNLGVLLGPVLVFFETRQNADLTRIAMEQGKGDVLAVIEHSLARPEIAAVWVKLDRTPEEGIDAEARMVESHLMSWMAQ